MQVVKFEIMSETYTKKASARIIHELLKHEAKVSGNTTYDQAFIKLMTAWDLEGGLANTGNKSLFYVYRDGELVHTFEWSKAEAYIEKERDWNWTFIYKTVLEHIIKTRLYKRPKIGKRAAAKLAKEKAAPVKPIETPIESPYKNMDSEALRKLKNNLSSKISRGKKTGMPENELNNLLKELDTVTVELKSRK